MWRKDLLGKGFVRSICSCVRLLFNDFNLDMIKIAPVNGIMEMLNQK